MSLLSETLKSLLGEVTLRQFAQQCDLAPATVHAVFEGRRCSHENLRAFVRYFSGDPTSQRAIVIAHLRDEIAASGIPDHDKIFVTEAPGSDLTFLASAPAMNADLGIVARGTLVHKEVREIISGLADMIMSLDAHIADLADPALGVRVTAPVADIDAVDAKAKKSRARAKAPAHSNS